MGRKQRKPQENSNDASISPKNIYVDALTEAGSRKRRTSLSNNKTDVSEKELKKGKRKTKKFSDDMLEREQEDVTKENDICVDISKKKKKKSKKSKNQEHQENVNVFENTENKEKIFNEKEYLEGENLCVDSQIRKKKKKKKILLNEPSDVNDQPNMDSDITENISTKKLNSIDENSDDNAAKSRKGKKKKRKGVLSEITADSSRNQNCESSEKVPDDDKYTNSSDDEVPVSSKRKCRVIDSDDESSGQESKSLPIESSKQKRINQAPSEPTPKRIKRCVDSSDDEVQTPKADRLKKLKQMADSVNKKRGRSLNFIDDEVSDQHQSDVTDEDDLPMFEHEEVPPDEKRCDDSPAESSSDGEDSFLDDEEEESGSGSEEADEDNEENNEEIDEDDDDEEKVHTNPYLDRGALSNQNVMEIFSQSIKALSKNTDEDKQNKKRYKEEMGKYQFATHSEKNKAALMDSKLRYKRNMKIAKFDKGLKDIRNLDVKDDEFHNTMEVCLFGQRVQIYPHSKMRSKKRGNCDLTGCSRDFVPLESKIVGAKIFDPFNLMFMKKRTKFDKEAYYWICRDHMLEDAESDSDDSD